MKRIVKFLKTELWVLTLLVLTLLVSCATPTTYIFPTVHKTNPNEINLIRASFLNSLTDDELTYLQNTPMVRYVTENSNYPVSFYSVYHDEWLGIAHDIFDVISELTGLTFERVSTLDDQWLDLITMLDNGEAAMITELLCPEIRTVQYLYSDPYSSDLYSLISKSNLPTLGWSDVHDMRVGVVHGKVYEALFHNLYPSHEYVVSFDCSDDLYRALINGDIDVTMGRNDQLLAINIFYGQVGYRSNLIYNIQVKSAFGFAPGEETLRSIINKSLSIIDTDIIVSSWAHTYYDYSAKIKEAQRPLLIATVIMSVSVLTLITVLVIKMRAEALRARSAIIRIKTEKGDGI